MPYQAIGKYHYYYEEDGDGPPLLLIAGYTADLSFWTSIRRTLAQKYRLLLFDNTGVGRSDYSEHLTIEQMAEDSLSLAEALGFHNPFVLGHSMGSAIAQTMAHRFPNRISKTILGQTFFRIQPASLWIMKVMLDLFEDGVSIRRRAQVILPWLFSNNFIENPFLIESFLLAHEKNPFPPSLDGLKKQYEALLQFDSRSWVSSIKKPCLVLAGNEDRLCPPIDAKEISELIEGSSFHLFEGVGHLASLEKPQEFCQVVSEFLKE